MYIKCFSHGCGMRWHAFAECECLGICDMQCVTECVWAQTSHLLAEEAFQERLDLRPRRDLCPQRGSKHLCRTPALGPARSRAQWLRNCTRVFVLDDQPVSSATGNRWCQRHGAWSSLCRGRVSRALRYDIPPPHAAIRRRTRRDAAGRDATPPDAPAAAGRHPRTPRDAAGRGETPPGAPAVARRLIFSEQWYIWHIFLRCGVDALNLGGRENTLKRGGPLK